MTQFFWPLFMPTFVYDFVKRSVSKPLLLSRMKNKGVENFGENRPRGVPHPYQY